MKRTFLLLLFAFLLVAPNGYSQEPPPDGAGAAKGRRLALSEALGTALASSPQLAVAGHQRDAALAFVRGHEGYPNPELTIESEDFLGTGPVRGVDALQVTAMVSQAVPLGGKPAKRREARRASSVISNQAWELARQQLVAGVSLAFLDVLGWQRRLENAREMVRLAEETQTAIEYQVEAGRGTPIEADKAAIARSLAALEEERVARSLLSAKQRLATWCGTTTPDFDEATGSIERIEQVPSLPGLLKRVDQHPALLTRAADVAHRQALLDVEQAKRVPDVSFGVGYRWINATEDSAVVAQVGLPLPIIDRNRGAIGAARHDKLASQSAADQERLLLVRDLTEAYHTLVLEHRRAVVLRDDVRPRVLATFQAVREGYAIGRFGYLDLLDAQRTLFEVTQQAIETLVAYHQSAIRLKQAASLPLQPASFQ